MKPRIGVTTTPATVDGRPVEQVNRSYVEAVVGAGGLPFILPVLDPDDAGAALLALDGLLLTGGGDVGPSLYGARPVPEIYGVDPARDASEVALARPRPGPGCPSSASAGAPRCSTWP